MDDKLKQSSPSNSRLPPPSMDIVREFLQYQVWGAEPQDVRRTVVGLHGVNRTASARSSPHSSRSPQMLTRAAP